MSILCAKAKVRYFRYHALRHLTASMLDDLGVAIGTIQRILGHQNRRTTEIYLHSIGEAERANPLICLAPQHGLEPRTQWLTATCSAD
jgi:integrase